MRSIPYLAVAAAMAAAMWLFTGDGWPAAAGGGILAVSLFFMLYFGAPQPGWRFLVPSVPAYALGALVTVAVGAIIGLFTDPGIVWYAVGAILAGSFIGANTLRTRTTGGA